MIHSPAEIIVELLIVKGLGTKFDANKPWPIYFGIMPSEPDNILTVYDTLGVKNGRIQQTGEVIIRPGIQVRIRNTIYNPGWKKGNDIAEAFDAIRNETVNYKTKVYRIHSITRPSGVIPLGQEAGKTRLLFTLNMTLTLSDITP